MHRSRRSPSPDRGKDDGKRRTDFGQPQDDYNRSRHGVSRSPRRHDYHHNARGRDSHIQDDMYDDGEVSDSRHGSDNGYLRREDGPREPQYHSQDDQHYATMYDDGPDAADGPPQAGHYPDERRLHGHSKDYIKDEYGDEYRASTPPRASHDQGRSQSPRRNSGRPSDTVILEGLPFGVSVDELRESLLSQSVAADMPSSIGLRLSSSRGNRRAFVQFGAEEDAVAFVHEHYPKILIDLHHSTDDVPDGKFEAYLHFARSRDPREYAEENWICSSCDFSNYSTRSQCKICGANPPAPAWQQNLTGLTDASDAPSQILVVYPLTAFINEDMFGGDMKRLELDKPDAIKEKSDGAPKLKSTAPSSNPAGYGARPGSLHRVFLMRRATNNESFKYGFAEFWTVDDASAALTKFRMARNFTVAACAVNICFSHMGVFVPEDREVVPAIEHMSFNPLFNPKMLVRYWDLHVYPNPSVVNSQPPRDGTAKHESERDGKKLKKRKADESLGAASTKKSVPMAGQMAMWQKKHSELTTGASLKSNGSTEPSSMGAVHSSVQKADSKGPITISLSTTRRLDGPAASAADAQKSENERNSPPKVDVPNSLDDATKDDAATSFVDRDRLICLICMRKYKSVDEVNIHERSRNHKTAMENDELVKAARARVASRSKKLPEQSPDADGAESATAQYRDRAMERRQAFSQPQKPKTQSKKSKSEYSSRKQPEEKPASSTPVPSKGAGMLAKMGWTSGAGLGAKEDGRTDAIATNAYQEGVGLGADGANLGDAAELAERKTTNSYAQYVNTVQDRARARYNNLG